MPGVGQPALPEGVRPFVISGSLALNFGLVVAIAVVVKVQPLGRHAGRCRRGQIVDAIISGGRRVGGGRVRGALGIRRHLGTEVCGGNRKAPA